MCYQIMHIHLFTFPPHFFHFILLILLAIFLIFPSCFLHLFPFHSPFLSVHLPLLCLRLLFMFYSAFFLLFLSPEYINHFLPFHVLYSLSISSLSHFLLFSHSILFSSKEWWSYYILPQWFSSIILGHVLLLLLSSSSSFIPIFSLPFGILVFFSSFPLNFFQRFVLIMA